MRKLYLVPLVLSACGLLGAAEDEPVTWLGNYQAALREARQTGKPILVEFRCEA